MIWPYSFLTVHAHVVVVLFKMLEATIILLIIYYGECTYWVQNCILKIISINSILNFDP